jgi:transcriptional regulator GlxA family with amidase domain/YHS domain-containing protein
MSVCNGSYVLAKAGLLDGKTATAHHNGYGMLRAMFPNVTVVRGVRYVEDGKIATAGGLTSGTDLAMRIVERYFGRDVAKATALSLEYQGTGWMYPKSNAQFAKRPVATADRAVCPVCEALISRNTKLTWQYGGKTYFFCSDFCKEHFMATPARFASVQ